MSAARLRKPRHRALQPTLRAIVTAAIVILPGACQPSHPTVILSPHAGEPVAVRVEIADSAEERSLGLMYRNDLAEDQGMLFLFEKDADHSFWMKNTPLSLDMIFISADGEVVGVAPDAEPFSLRPVRIHKSSRDVLEVRAGFAKRHGIAAGARARYAGFTRPNWQ